MTRSMQRVACAVAAAAAALTLGAGVAQASAPSVTGEKYGDASAAISGAGMKAVVATTVGDQKSWSDCLVSNAHERTMAAPENSSGSAVNEVLVSLNCDAAPASNKVPGYSAASPEGAALKAAAAKEKNATKSQAAG
ncbi:hypothetical protein GCM10023114_45930 [Mycolicibacterium sediminis]|uniref:PASTA domain-containing protein n=1 Tax=Mycolicibacterium sediminis TaxID=1286180 RepID=A0A7I7QMY4_9MYCO|nr:hypothetical protein MSEDJ_17500 [Mycolicibacterium sediminis]